MSAVMKTQNVKLTIAYDGTHYHGYQEQRGTGLQTIQETLEDGLGRILGIPIKTYVAGRTDAGVHARGQVVNFKCEGLSIPVERIPLAVNRILPEDIAVIGAEKVPDGFNAQLSAVSKLYKYYIFNSRQRSPFSRLYSYFEPRSLDLTAMERAGSMLVGSHDFKSFQASGSTVKNTVREIYKCKVDRVGSLVGIAFRGDGFLYNMVRILAGTLLNVGLEKIHYSDIPNILKAKDRRLAGPTVPSRGLFLEKVNYNTEDFS